MTRHDMEYRYSREPSRKEQSDRYLAWIGARCESGGWIRFWRLWMVILVLDKFYLTCFADGCLADWLVGWWIAR
ncbi:hypothetical protein EYC80_002011 [Monilinia laxa]|uniref:Uncharacterized protein n=1 Tax=Monilinia laxa TaxID=61186 RepID=A0A5N6K6W6_MONLA|nr:hypothetical protein EYC80_002011 [Monilinia laxa]